MMKKILCLVLAALLLVLCLAGCGKKKPSKDTSSSKPSSPAPSASSEVAPAATATPAPPVQKAKAAKVKADGGLNIRSEPNTDCEILGLAEDGSLLPLLKEKADDGWYNVEYDGKPAYISAEYASVVEITLDEYNKLKTGNASDTSAKNDDPGKVSAASKGESTASKTETSEADGNSEDGE